MMPLTLPYSDSIFTKIGKSYSTRVGSFYDATNRLLDNFRMKPLEPCNKIKKENYLLTKAIKDDNDAFYWFIKEHISQLDAVKSSFRTIASEIKSAFLKLNQEGYDQFEIFKQLTDWIMKEHLLPASYYQAAHIIVSYFVQSCEVFDEISK